MKLLHLCCTPLFQDVMLDHHHIRSMQKYNQGLTQATASQSPDEGCGVSNTCVSQFWHFFPTECCRGGYRLAVSCVAT